jgi:hypothetical protein
MTGFYWQPDGTRSNTASSAVQCTSIHNLDKSENCHIEGYLSGEGPNVIDVTGILASIFLFSSEYRDNALKQATTSLVNIHLY